MKATFWEVHDSLEAIGYVPAGGQQTNSTPLKASKPHGRRMAWSWKLIRRWWHLVSAIFFHSLLFAQILELCSWSNAHLSGTRRASDWNGPTISRKGGVDRKKRINEKNKIRNWVDKTPFFNQTIICIFTYRDTWKV